MRRHAFDRDWTKGSIAGNLLALAWPVIVAQSLNTVGPIVDMIWVGRLGAAAIAGVGVSSLLVQLINPMMMGLATGARALIARFMGANDAAGANHVSQQAFVVSTGFAIFVAAIGIFLAEPILALFGLEADVVAEGAAYMRIMFAGSAANSFMAMVEGMMQSSGDAVTPMRIAVFVRLFHVALDPFLIFGWWSFPRLGVSGAALANIFSQSLGVTFGLWVLFTGRTRLQLTLKNFRLDPNIIWRMVKVGLPASFQGMERSFSHLALMRILVPFGTLAVAAQSLLARVESNIVVTQCAALGRSAGVLAGQNLGAGQPERAVKSSWLAAGIAEAFVVSFSVAMLFWPTSVISIFGAQPDVVKIASTFLMIATTGWLMLSVSQVLMNAMSGAGDTLPPMVITLMGMWLVELPMAFFLPRVTNLGVYGVRWGTAIGQTVRGVAYLAYFKTGKWKYKKV
ncbi:MAG: MATE family efflux transporter [Chloroflexi bacterium]|nr:MATE family efflux transporter [Chloroflexota bacterium]